MKVAQLSSWILNLFGMNTESVNSIVFGPKSRIAIDITYKCTSIIQIAFFSAGVFAYSCKLSKKLIGMIAGIPLIFGTNLVRIVSLFFIGVIAFPFFDFAHKVIGEVLMIIVTFLAWLFWLKRMSPALAKSSDAQ
jgi:archaeosortase B (VPXXXP-CTERM-specific)